MEVTSQFTVMFLVALFFFFFCWEKVGGGRGQERKLLKGRGRTRELGKETREAGGGKGGATRRHFSGASVRQKVTMALRLLTGEPRCFHFASQNSTVWQEGTFQLPILLPRSSTFNHQHRPSSPRCARITPTCHSTLRHGPMLSGCSVPFSCSTFPRPSGQLPVVHLTSIYQAISSSLLPSRGNPSRYVRLMSTFYFPLLAIRSDATVNHARVLQLLVSRGTQIGTY